LPDDRSWPIADIRPSVRDNRDHSLAKGNVVSREDYVAVAARLFAVYITFQVVLQLPVGAQTLSQDQDMVWAGLYVLALLVSLALCAFLWFFPLTIARKLLPVMKEPRSDQAINASVGLSLGLTLIGIWFLAEGTIGAVYWLALIVRTKQHVEQLDFEWSPEQLASMASTVFEVAVGACLVLGSTGLRQLIHRLRYAGNDAR
jgi:hypothetical protein